MPHTISKTVYYFDELSGNAKEKARDWYRNGALDYDWWDSTYEDAKHVLSLAGFTVDKIFFSGFSNQGDGAMFEASWDAKDVKPGKLVEECPQDADLHAIASGCESFALTFPNASLSIEQRGRCNHEHCTAFSTDLNIDRDEEGHTPEEWDEINKKDAEHEEAIEELSRDAMRWIYRQLEKEYDYLNSDEQVDETIIANEYEFTDTGRRAT